MDWMNAKSLRRCVKMFPVWKDRKRNKKIIDNLNSCYFQVHIYIYMIIICTYESSYLLVYILDHTRYM